MRKSQGSDSLLNTKLEEGSFVLEGSLKKKGAALSRQGVAYVRLILTETRRRHKEIGQGRNLWSAPEPVWTVELLAQRLDLCCLQYFL